MLDQNPIFFLDYDGTLVKIVPNPEDAVADPELIDLLKKLSAKYETYIVTGRSFDDIIGFLGKDLDIIALHGALIYRDGVLTHNIEGFEEFERTCDRIYHESNGLVKIYPGLRTYNKHGNVLFHLGLMKTDQRAALIEHVEKLAIENSLDVYHGKNIVELRIPGINKGVAINQVSKGRPSIIVGDDATDEDAFLANPSAMTIHVGPGPTAARFILSGPDETRALIKTVLSRS